MNSKYNIASPELRIDSLYIFLDARSDSPDDGFHWGLYHHTSPTSGMKYHIRNLGEGWITEHAANTSITKQFLLVGMLRIANVPESRWNTLDTIVQSVPYVEPGTTCRTWVLDAIRRLATVEIVSYSSLDDLETDAKTFGVTYFDGVLTNVQPRPIADSLVARRLG